MPALHPDPLFDRELRRSLAVATRGAADAGDVLRVARRLRAGDVAGWEREWQRIADRVLAAGDELLGADDPDGACRAFLRAAEYYRQAGVFADDESQHALDIAHVNAFRAAMPLLPVLAEIVEMGEPAGLQGYLFQAFGEPDRPLALAIVGDYSTAEAGYAAVAVPVVDQGMNCLILDDAGDQDDRGTAACWSSAVATATCWIADRPDLNRAQLVILPPQIHSPMS